MKMKAKMQVRQARMRRINRKTHQMLQEMIRRRKKELDTVVIIKIPVNGQLINGWNIGN